MAVMRGMLQFHTSSQATPFWVRSWPLGCTAGFLLWVTQPHAEAGHICLGEQLAVGSLQSV